MMRRMQQPKDYIKAFWNFAQLFRASSQAEMLFWW
jgi:hypothetical protein